MTPLAYLVHEPHPFLIRFTENFGVRYYGLSYLLGFVVGAWLLYRYDRAGRSRLPAAKISDCMVAMVLGVMVGGRLGEFLLYHPRELVTDPLSFFRVWEGGMASHGGFAGVTIAMAWFARANRIPFLHLSDLITSASAAGLLFGRLANYLNGELWGKVTDVPWAVIFPTSAAPGTPLHLILPRHPSQLYEAALEGGLLLAFLQWRFWRSSVVRDQPGRLAAEFLIAYPLARILCERFREPDGIILGLSSGTFYSVLMLSAGLVLLAYTTRRRA